ncbi:MAG: hypothetical protein R3F46_05700 [bacterium]
MDSDVKQYRTPRSLPNGNGQEELAVSREDYIDLLVAASVTDPQAWPDGMQQCAALLARIREIEAGCISQHGTWDWEKLDEDSQDEYDELSLTLDRLRNPGKPVRISDL